MEPITLSIPYDEDKINKIIQNLKSFILSNNPDDFYKEMDKEYKKIKDDLVVRIKFCVNFAWTIPNENTINSIKEFVNKDKILEVGAGNGLWSCLLTYKGVYIKPTDNYGKQYFNVKDNLTFIEKLDHIQAITKYNEYEVLMLIWPPMTPMAYESLKEFKGNKVIYSGEGIGGCTADEDFFMELDENWTIQKFVYNPKFNGIGDNFTFYTRNDINTSS